MFCKILIAAYLTDLYFDHVNTHSIAQGRSKVSLYFPSASWDFTVSVFIDNNAH